MKSVRVMTAVALSLFAAMGTASFSDSMTPTIGETGILPVAAVKSTPFGKYISSKHAHELLEKDPNLLFVDVRDPIEISKTGRPLHIDAIVPLQVQTSTFDEGLGEYTLVDNPSFTASMFEALEAAGKSKHDMIIITCGSGYRSARAATELAAAGFTNVWHIPDGYPGDEKPGLNTHNAWNLQGLPWSYDVVHGSEWVKLIDDAELVDQVPG